MAWLEDIHRIVSRLPREFTLADVYSHAPALAKKHPNNHNVEAKIRQQLQVLRDQGLIRFVDGNGRYERVTRY